MKVPTYDNLQVGSNLQPTARFEAPDMPDVAGPQLQQMGQAATRAGVEVARFTAEKLNEANQLRRLDARNRARETLNTLIYDSSEGVLAQKGIAALERSSKKALPDEYAERFKDAVDEITATLGNDQQRELFKRDAAEMHLQLNETARRHFLKEMTTYKLGTYDGAIKSQQRAIALMGGNGQDMIDPVTKRSRIDDATDEIRAAVFAKARQLGVPQELAEQEAITQLSAAHHDAFSAAVQAGKLQYAESYLEKYRGQMTPDHIMASQAVITKQMDSQVAVSIATQEVQKVAPTLHRNELSRTWDAMIVAESGGRQFAASGQPLTSPKGAIGIAQVMPATAREVAKKHGIPWDEDRYRTDPEYNKALGRAHFGDLVQEFGDVELAMAAYNAGSGAVRKALAQASRPVKIDAGDPNAPNPSGKVFPHRMGWRDFVPKETQAYVAKIQQSLARGDGITPMPTEADVHAAVLARLGPGASPERRRLALAESSRQFAEQQQAVKTRDEGIMAEVQRQLVANGGNFTALSPTLRSLVPPGQVDNLMGFAGRIAKGVPPETNWARYYVLMNKPEVLKQTNLMAYRAELGDTEFKALIARQTDLLAGKDQTEILPIKEVMNSYMRQIGIDPTPRDDDRTGAEKVGKIWGYFDRRVRAEEQAKGRKLSPEELEKQAAATFLKVGVDRPYWFGSTEKPAALVSAEDKITKVPDEQRQQIIESIRRAGHPVTEENITAVFRSYLKIRDDASKQPAGFAAAVRETAPLLNLLHPVSMGIGTASEVVGRQLNK
jgi:soluble lytic murein transglycosylase